MKTDVRVSVKNYRRNRSDKILLSQLKYSLRQFFVRMNGKKWPKDGRPVSITKVMTTLRKSLVKSF